LFNLFRKVKVEKINTGSHGDHWGAYLGFDNLRQSPQRLINILEQVSEKKCIGQSRGYSIHSIGREGMDINVLCQLKSQKIRTGFPVVQNAKSFDLKNSAVIEWSHMDGIEGLVRGSVADTFGVTFFATDYIEQEKRYKSEEQFRVCLAGMAYSVGSPPELTEGFSADFVCYLPRTVSQSSDVYDFVGKILKFEPYEDKFVSGYFLEIELVSGENPFVLPVYVHRDNLDTELSVNGRVGGVLWIQGRINE